MNRVSRAIESASEYLMDPMGARNALIGTAVGSAAVGAVIEVFADTPFEGVLGGGFITIGALLGLGSYNQHREGRRRQENEAFLQQLDLQR